MKTNLPDGISQQNRTHPYFIMLRNQNDEQQRLSRTVVHRFLTDLLRTSFLTVVGAGLIILIGALCHHVIPVTNCLAMAVAVPAVLAIHYVGRYRRLKRILSRQTNVRVEQMLYSNEFQSAILNHEEVLNLMMQCNRVSGMLENFSSDIDQQAVTVIVTELILAAVLTLL